MYQRYLELRLLLLLLISNDIYTLTQYSYNIILIGTCIYYPLIWLLVYKYPSSIYYINPITQIVIAYTSLYKMNVFTSNTSTNLATYHYLMYGQVSAVSFYILKSSNYILNFCGALGAEIIYFYGYNFSFFLSRIMMVLIFYLFQDYVVCKSERMSFYLKQKEAEWRSIISKVLPLKVIISEFDYIACNLKLYDCSREAQNYVKDKCQTMKFLDILTRINVDMQTSILNKSIQQQEMMQKNESNFKNTNDRQNTDASQFKSFSQNEKKKGNINQESDLENNMINLKTYLLHRHIGIEKDQQKERPKKFNFNISNPFTNSKNKVKKQSVQNIYDQLGKKQKNEENENDKTFDANNLYKLDTLQGYYFESEDSTTYSEKLQIKIAYYQLFKPLLVVYFEDQTIQNDYINIKEQKQRFDQLFVEILENFRQQITSIIKQGFELKKMNQLKNKLLLMLNNLYVIFDYYVISSMKKNILNLQSQSYELNIKRNSFQIQDIFKEVKDIYKDVIQLKIPDTLKNTIIHNDIRRIKQLIFALIACISRVCSNSKIQIIISFVSDEKLLWKGIKFSISGFKDLNVNENQIFDFFTDDKFQQLNDLNFFVLNSIVKIIGPYNFKSSCSPQDEIVFEFTVFEDIGLIFIEQYLDKSPSFRNSPSLIPYQTKGKTQTLHQAFQLDYDASKTSINSNYDQKPSTTFGIHNTQNSYQTIDNRIIINKNLKNKTPLNRFHRAQSYNVQHSHPLKHQSSFDKAIHTNSSSKEILSLQNTNQTLLSQNQTQLDTNNSDNSISISFKNISKTPPSKPQKQVLRHANTLFLSRNYSRKKTSIVLNQEQLKELQQNCIIQYDNPNQLDENLENQLQKSRMSQFSKNNINQNKTKQIYNNSDHIKSQTNNDNLLNINRINIESIQEESLINSKKEKNELDSSIDQNQKQTTNQLEKQHSSYSNQSQKVFVHINSIISDSSLYSSSINDKSNVNDHSYVYHSKQFKGDTMSNLEENQSTYIDEKNLCERGDSSIYTNKVIQENYKSFNKYYKKQ